MNYAWVIDQTRCIACDTCSRACKSENGLPRGVHWTWLKGVEVGEFPKVRRHFAILRCNQCTDPPCVPICPTGAIFQQRNGIVDIDQKRCVGCQACMQACPYDAICLDPVSATATKCHFCSHRLERNQMPACVTVCPTQALVAGDLDDPESRANILIGSNPVTVRRPERGTKPKTFYLGAHPAVLDPRAATDNEASLWTRRSGTKPRSGATKVRVAYNLLHRIPWRARVSTYLWTKSIAAGSAFVAAMFLLMGLAFPDPLLETAVVLAMLALGVTCILLAADLKKPNRLLQALIRPQWHSWIVKGACIITAYGIVLACWLAMGLMGFPASPALLCITAVLAAGTGLYTAMLFRQCKARDLWQSPVIAVSLLIQMVIAGAAALILLCAMIPANGGAVENLALLLAAALVLHGLSLGLGAAAVRSGVGDAAAAADVMLMGKYAPLFWTSMIFGVAVPVAILLATSSVGLIALAAALALFALLPCDHAFVMAGQAVPIS